MCIWNLTPPKNDGELGDRDETWFHHLIFEWTQWTWFLSSHRKVVFCLPQMQNAAAVVAMRNPVAMDIAEEWWLFPPGVMMAVRLDDAFILPKKLRWTWGANPKVTAFAPSFRGLPTMVIGRFGAHESSRVAGEWRGFQHPQFEAIQSRWSIAYGTFLKGSCWRESPAKWTKLKLMIHHLGSRESACYWTQVVSLCPSKY